MIGAERLKFRRPVDLRMIYMLPGRPKHITGKVAFFGLRLEYPIYFIEDYSYKEFLYSDRPEDVVLSILTDKEDITGEQMVKLVISRLKELVGDKDAIRKFLKQLKVLSSLRNLHLETQKQIQNMTLTQLTEEVVTNDEWYLVGLEKGKEEGMEKGMEKGKLLKDLVAIRNMAHLHFKADMIAGILSVSEKFVGSIMLQLAKEADIVAALKKNRASVKTVAARLKVSPVLVQVIQEAQKVAQNQVGNAPK